MSRWQNSATEWQSLEHETRFPICKVAIVAIVAIALSVYLVSNKPSEGERVHVFGENATFATGSARRMRKDLPLDRHGNASQVMEQQ